MTNTTATAGDYDFDGGAPNRSPNNVQLYTSPYSTSISENGHNGLGHGMPTTEFDPPQLMHHFAFPEDRVFRVKTDLIHKELMPEPSDMQRRDESHATTKRIKEHFAYNIPIPDNRTLMIIALLAIAVIGGIWLWKKNKRTSYKTIGSAYSRRYY
jgi:hypothetical protein